MTSPPLPPLSKSSSLFAKCRALKQYERLAAMVKFGVSEQPSLPTPHGRRVTRWQPLLQPCAMPSAGGMSRWVNAGPPPCFGPDAQNGRPHCGPRGAVRRRSDPSLNSQISQATSGGQISSIHCTWPGGQNTRRGRGGSLECLQYVGHLVNDILPSHQGHGDESDVSSEASSYSAVVARSRRASLNADSDSASSSGVSSLSSAGCAPVCVSVAIAANAAAAATSTTITAKTATNSNPLHVVATLRITPEIPEISEESELTEIPEFRKSNEENLCEFDVDLPVGFDPRGVESPDHTALAKCVIWYQGRNLLDMGWNLQSPWPLRYAILPSADPHFFLLNRAQYHRLGHNGLQSPEKMMQCGSCGFLLPRY